MKTVFFLYIFLIISFSVTSQRTHLTTFTGFSNYNGELQSKPYTFKNAHAVFGIGLEYELTNKIFLRTGLSYGTISGKDSGTINYKRNLNFTTKITEFQVGIEYNFLNLKNKDITPYLFGGIAVFHFNPYTKSVAGQKVYLQPLGTEGQGYLKGRDKYALTQFSIPLGAGVKYALSDYIRIGAEVGLRKTFTDYLDDVSTYYINKNELLLNNGAQAVEFAFRGDETVNRLSYPAEGKKRGNPASDDWYYFTGLTISFRLGDLEKNGYSSRF